MIRIKVLDYNELRENYLKKLLVTGAARFDKNDILDSDIFPSEGISQETFETLNKLSESSDFIKGIKDHLYEKSGRVKRAELRRLLAGPEEIPYGFGGHQNVTLLSFLNSIIGKLGKCPDDKNIKETICTIFNYDKFKSGKGRDLSYWLMRELHQDTCPYCNIGYTSVVSGKRKSYRAAFDHYLPKSIYPYLAICLFNLIPACNTCNNLKSDDERAVIYPFEESFDEQDKHCSFRIIPNAGHPEVLTGDNKDFKIQFRFSNTDYYNTLVDIDMGIQKSVLDRIEEWERIIGSIETFALEDVYSQCHKEEILHLLKNYYVYNRTGIDMMLKGIPGLSNNKEMIRDMLYFGFLKIEEWGNSPLNKLKYDILQELDMIVNYDR